MNLPVVAGGEVTVSGAPGLGLDLLPEVFAPPDAVVRVSRAGR